MTSRPAAPPLTLKAAVAVAGGWPLCVLPPFRGLKKRLLATWPTPGKRSKLENLLFKLVFSHWWRREYLAETDPDKREAMKALLMGGDSGADWAAYYDATPVSLDGKVGHLPFVEAVPLLPELDALLAKQPEPAVVVQIGASSGRETAWLAARHPRHAFVGTDVFPEVVAFASGHHKHANLSFETRGAVGIKAVVDRYQGRPVYLISSGSLQYVQPEHVVRMLESLKGRRATELLLLEPGNEAWGPADGLGRSIYSGNLSYTHDYRALAERAGWRTLASRVIRPYSPYEAFPQHLHTVHYFYRGTAEA